MTIKKSDRELRDDGVYRALFECSPDGIVIADPQSNYIDVNATICGMLGYTRDELIGLHASDIVTEAEIPHIGSALIALEAKSDYHREWQFRRKDDSVFAADVIATMMPDGNLLGVIRDITERKRTEKALRESEEHFRFLNDLAEATRRLEDPAQIMAVMARMLGEHLSASRCAYADVEKDGDQFTILHDYIDGCESTVGSYKLSLFGFRSVATLYSGQTLIIRNVDAELLPGEGAEMFDAIGIKAIITCPLVKEGSLRAMMAVHQTTPRDWQSGEIAIVQDVVERCWATIERRAAEAKILVLNADLERRVVERTAALRASEARYRMLFDSIDEGFCIIEMIFDEQEKPVDYRFLEVNPSFERQTGLRDSVGKSMRELAPQHEEHWFETFGHIAVTGERTRFQNHAKELHRWFDVYACRFGEPKNRQVAIVFGDITERKVAETNIAQLNTELQQRAAELKSLFESLPGHYLVLTPDLKIVAASDAYLTATMTTREGILGRSLFEVFPDNPNDPETKAVSNMQASIDRVIRNAVPDTMAIQKHDIRRPDGVFEEHYWSPINSPMFGADRVLKYIVHRVEDVTEFVKQKAQPSGSNVELSARVQQMEAEVFQSSQNLQASNQQLEAANKELESFSYSVSHDLRAPLRHINGFSQALLEDYADKLDETGKDYLQQLRGASQEMAQLIDDVLQLARVTRGDMHREDVNLSELARTVIANLKKREGQREVTIKIEDELTTRCDKRLLGIVLTNLLGNAWKFTSKQEHAEITFGSEQRNGDLFYFVRDNGAGFDMTYVNKLFGAFQRLHTASEFEGTGIGLATVQRVINRHGGHVRAKGIVNQGATFYFTLPEFKEIKNGQQSDLTG